MECPLMKYSKMSWPLLVVAVLFTSKLCAQISNAKQVVGQYKNVFATPPVKTPNTVSVDGPLLGNGFVAVAMAGAPEQQTYFFARNDFWRLKSGYNESFPVVLGKLQINIPALKAASYRVEQDLYRAVTIADFSKKDTAVRITSTLTATKDWLLIDITNKGTAIVKGQVLLSLPGADQFRVKPPLENKFADTVLYGKNKGMQSLQRGFVQGVDIPTMSAVAVKIVNNTSPEFSILPGQTITLLCVFSSNFKTSDCLKTVQQQVQQASVSAIAKVRNEHAAWWSRYWNESFVSIGDSLIEQQYYKRQK